MTQLDLTAPASTVADGRTRGACPTLREPMQTGDGLLARLRPVGGVVSPSQLRGIAELAELFGNGQIEITARGNLQVRGLEADVVPAFATAIEGLIAVETGTPIEVSPLAGLDPDEVADARPLANAIRAALRGSSVAERLGPKVTVVVDGVSAWDRRALAADIRLTAFDNGKWRLEIGGQPLGLLFERDAASVTLIALTMIAAMDGRGRDVDVGAARQRLHGLLLADASIPAQSASSAPVTALTDGRFAAAIWLPFGAARASLLVELADEAARLSVSEFRLAPHHGLLAICPSEEGAAAVQQATGALGLVTTATDPRRAISACIGSDGCASGFVAARSMAEALAQSEPEFFDHSFDLHVAGCAKGCAHPSTALLTLVGTKVGLDLVIDGSAKGAPAVSFSSEAAPVAMHQLAALWRDERALGESVAACFKRLGAAKVAAAVRQGWQ